MPHVNHEKYYIDNTSKDNKGLVKEEESVRSRRVEHFRGTGFVMGDL